MRDNLQPTEEFSAGGHMTAETPAPLAPVTRNRRKWRHILLAAGPLAVVLASGYMYATGGRYITTDNAYVKADIVSVSPEINGPIVKVLVRDNQPVKAGQLLFAIDPAPFRLAMATAQANLTRARSDIGTMRARYLRAQADLSIAQSNRALAAKDYGRLQAIQKRNTGAVSAQEADKSRHDAESATQQIGVLEQEAAGILAGLDGDPDMKVDQHATVKAAQAAVDQAQLNLDRTQVRAPADGTVGAAPKVGDYAHAQVPALSVVQSGGAYVAANFKETELTRMRAGQPARLRVDTYPGYEWEAKLDSISPASESEFSILPAQNATGNWVKVVQRIPVRLTIIHKPDEPALRAGMSTEVRVDTGSYPHAAFLNR